VTVNGPNTEYYQRDVFGSCSWVVHVPGFVGGSRLVLFWSAPARAADGTESRCSQEAAVAPVDLISTNAIVRESAKRDRSSKVATSSGRIATAATHRFRSVAAFRYDSR
jgi:hypothetical protein